MDGTLSVLNNPTGSVVCGTAVGGRATFAGDVGGVLRQGRRHSEHDGGRTTLDDNIGNGVLRLTANNPVAEVAGNDNVRGGIVGDHSAPAVSGAAEDGVRGTAEERARERRAQAGASTAAKGAARL